MNKKTRILMVDDNQMFVEHLSYHLEQEADLEIVATARDGTRAIAKAQLFQPDVVLLDMNMPGIDGFKTLPLLREAVPNARLIVLTSLHDDESIEQAYRCGAHAFVQKATMADDLLLEIKRS